MIRNLVYTYVLGVGWLWWLFGAAGVTQLWLGIAQCLLTGALFVAVARRSRRLRSEHEAVGGRLITHVGLGESRWSRHTDDEGDDFEAHVGGGGF